MNSDEDPSFHFMCEGSSGVLGIFGDTSVLPVMSTSTAVSDLEDVFAKATASIPLPRTAKTSCQKKTVIKKDSTNDVVSGFEVDSTLLSHANDDSKKVSQFDESSALSGNAALSTEMREVLIDANQTLETENSSLVSVEESTKTIEEATDATVVGTVELAEEIMEAFANSKAVLDAENPVSTDTVSLQEEMDQLDQLAVERVLEIEGELVSSSKQIAESNLDLDISKVTESNEENNGVEKTFVKDLASSSNLVVSHSAEVTAEIADESSHDLRRNGVQISTSSEETFEISGACEDSEEDFVEHEVTCKISEVKSIHKMPEFKDTGSDEENERDEQEECEKLEQFGKPENDILVQKDLSKYVKTKGFLQKELSEEDKSNNKLLEPEDKAYAASELKKYILPFEIDNKATSWPKETDQQDTKFEEMGKQDHSKETKKNNNLHNIQESNMQGQEKVVDDEKKDEFKSTLKDNQPLSEIDEKTSTEQQGEEKNRNIKDIQSYDTEDDDLEVLEAFIVRSATNPEIAICSTDTEKGEMPEKYTEESALIDDLTKADDNSMSGSEKEVEIQKEATTSTKESVSVTPLRQAFIALENTSQIIVSADVHSPENQSKFLGNDALPHLGTHKLFMSNGNQLPLKKRLSQRPVVDMEQIELDSNSSKVAVDKKVEKKIITVEVVKQGRIRLPGTARKSLSIQKGSTNDKYKSIVALTRIDDKNIDSASKRVSRDLNKAVKKAVNNSSKRENVANKSNSGEGTNKQSVVSKPIESPVSRKRLRNTRRKIIDDEDDDKPLREKKTKREILSPNAKTKSLKRSLGENIEDRASTSQESIVSEKVTTRRSSSDESTIKHKKKLKDEFSSLTKVKSKKEYSTRSTPVQEKCIEDRVLSATSSKTNQKDEKKLKVVSTPAVIKSFTKNNLTKSPPHATRSSKRVKSIRVSPSPKPFKKIKYKENVGKATDSSNTKKLERIELPPQCNSSSLHSSNSEKSVSNGKLQTVQLAKQKNAKRIISDDSPISSLAFKRNQVERETKENESSINLVENISDVHTTKSLQKLKETYCDRYALEFEDISFEMLKDKAKQLALPSSLWGVQICHEKDTVIFSRVCTEIAGSKPLSDKAIVFQGSLKPVALIMNQPVDLPISSIRTFEDVVLLIRNFHTVSFCEGTGVTQRPLSKYCFRYQDVANPARRCSQCLEERRRAIFGSIRKLREKLRLLQVEKEQQ